jgi:flagellar motor switch protein FliN/FliY
MADDQNMSQSEIDRILQQAMGGAPDAGVSSPANPPAAAPPKPAPAVKPGAGYESVSPEDIELLLNKAEEALASIDAGGKDAMQALPVGMRSFEFEKFRGSSANSEAATLELMRDVQLDMTVELGRTHMHLEDVLQLRKGAVVPLDKLAGDPADIFVNGRLIARGEVLVLNDNFCIRVAELIAGEAA